jgi:hypothetical protein
VCTKEPVHFQKPGEQGYTGFTVIHPHNPDPIFIGKIDLIPIGSLFIGMDIKYRHVTIRGNRFSLTLNEQAGHGIITVRIPSGKKQYFQAVFQSSYKLFSKITS